MTEALQIRLRRRDGSLAAVALIDDVDRHLAEGQWYLAIEGYVKRRGPDGKMQYLHRAIAGLTRGDGLEVDHINGDKLDNRRQNLRVVTHGQNGQNVKPQEGRSSSYRGVSWVPRKRKWVAYGHVQKKKRHLGYFQGEEEAARAARAFREVHMEFTVEDRT